MRTKTMPLSLVTERTAVRMVSANCGRGLRARLTSMGLRPGAEFTVIRSNGPGPLVVAMGHSRLGLGRGIAHKIMVVPVAAG
ncbi:MAG: ferrous iron transport protein A [Planctomycetes bacterium]|nr:ferrous iron transport protein A [Planctomycetota bacterium]